MGEATGERVHVNLGEYPIGRLERDDANRVVEAAAHRGKAERLRKSARDVVPEDGERRRGQFEVPGNT